MRKLLLFLIVSFVLSSSVLRADEGMWIPLLLNKYNIEDMQKMGLKLSAEDIYSINNSSLKDAVMIFGGGCTAELISDEGLIITNHHCGYGEIQRHSTLEHDYLTDGFWAMNRSEELVNPDLTVEFLVRMEDVTAKVLDSVSDNLTEQQRNAIIKTNIDKLEAEAVEGTHYTATIKPFFGGNEYYLFVEEVFKDVRLVGAPPSAIGKFGGDTDNWMWPRHTGDFSVFRVYANRHNEPAKYAEENVPYHPKKHFTISLQGVEKGDFTMVFGYPGSTQQYLPSYAVNMIQNIQNPQRIALRQAKIDIMRQTMEADPQVRIQYSLKYARVSNAWKKWRGEIRGLERLNAVERKQAEEAAFTEWVNASAARKSEYGQILPEYEKLYNELTPYELATDYVFEAGFGLDLVMYAHAFRDLVTLSNEDADEEMIQEEIEYLMDKTNSFFKDYHLPTDKRIFAKLLQMYYDNMETGFRPKLFEDLIAGKYDGNLTEYAEDVYSKSFFVNKKEMLDFLENYSANKAKKIEKDPVYELYNSIFNLYVSQLMPKNNEYETLLGRLDRLYIKALREMQTDTVLYPDANFTLRVAYGKVDNYRPRDGVLYQYYTTLSGIIAKDNPDIYDYRVPQKLKELYENKDYGRYAQDGQMRVCFIATNHTTGGNSGSPVINGEGQLVGINFDRCWEGTMSDIMYDPEMCRNITLDIRYALFIIDKFAGASHLIEEMTIVE